MAMVKGEEEVEVANVIGVVEHVGHGIGGPPFELV
jgi:hypothetical protein